MLIEEAGADVNHEDHRGFTALQWASRQGHAGVVELIINENPDIDHRNQQGTTSLMFASGMGHLKVVRILLDAGADANETNNDGDTSLLWAAGAGCIDIVKLLIEEHYAYVDHQNKRWFDAPNEGFPQRPRRLRGVSPPYIRCRAKESNAHAGARVC